MTERSFDFGEAADELCRGKRMLNQMKGWARKIKRDVHALWLAARDPRTPWYAKAVAFSIAAYALSPIDLIPDFIPVLGYLDDLIILPLAVLVAVRLIPAEILREHRATAAGPVSKGAALCIVALWAAAAILTGWWLYRWQFGGG